MSLIKCTMLMQLATNVSNSQSGHRVAGWSESVYSPNGNLIGLKTEFENLCQKRAGLLPAGGSVIGQRYQLIDPSGRTTTSKKQFPGSTDASDLPNVALTFTVPSKTTPNVRRFTLRAFPDQYITEGEFLPTGLIMSRLNYFVAALAPFVFKAANLEAPKVDMVSIDNTGAFILGDALTFAENDIVKISRTIDSGGDSLSGRFRIKTATSGTTGSVYGWTGGTREKGTMQVVTPIYPLFDTSQPVQGTAVTRKVGRPLGGFRGRASRRA